MAQTNGVISSQASSVGKARTLARAWLDPGEPWGPGGAWGALGSLGGLALGSPGALESPGAPGGSGSLRHIT